MSERTDDADGRTNVAIACQGGGSHTAFTAGVLKGLFREWPEEYELVGISGTSGGAFNALAAWYGLVSADEARAVELLDAVWDDLAATDLTDRFVNDWVVGLSRLESKGFPMAQFSPYQTPGPELGKEAIRETLERHIDFDDVPDYCTEKAPVLVVGTVNVNAGVFETFLDEQVTVDAVLASAAVPTLFEAVEIDGHLHWDGLFSQNPPIDDLMADDAGRKPDELWIIQINSQEIEGEPTSLEEIADRRNELAGNISLNQELHVIKRVNEWIDAGHLPESQFSRTAVRRIPMEANYHCSTKVDRSPSFIRELMDLGEERAAAFLEAGPPDESAYTVSEPRHSSPTQ